MLALTLLSPFKTRARSWWASTTTESTTIIMSNAKVGPMLATSVRQVARSAGSALLACLFAFTLGPGHRPQAQGSPGCQPPSSNPIVCENLLPGNPSSEWDVSGAGDSSIQGFATDISVDQGQTVVFKINTNASAYRLDLYRMGYYGGMGARKVATVSPSASLPQSQPNCLSDAATGLIDCGNWAVSASWQVPLSAVSGIYFARVIRTDTGGASHIFFVVRDDDGASDLLFQTSDTTWQAYNTYGGNSLYVGQPAGRAYKVSYNRPFTTRAYAPEDWVFNAEYPMVRWLEANGYWVSYSTGVDSDRRGAEIRKHKVFLSVGHDEYWSGTQRANVEAARAAGVNLAFFSGNEVFWKTRWENSISANGAPHRTLVSYKETHANSKIDPAANVWTGTWRDPRFSPPADGGRPENALTGTIFYVNSGTSGIRIPADEGKLRFWRNTTVANLAPGAFATMPNGTLGYEWDEDRDNGFRPPGLIRLSDTTVSGVDYLQDYGSTYGPGTANHALTLYRHASGALVFGAGTVQWSWGLDSNHDRGSAPPNQAMQQATINLLADMAAHPLTAQAGLTTASPSSDTLTPSSAISSPAHGSGVPSNTAITISGTAADAGGGVVGGVEVSTDGGATWRRATGRNNWSYVWQTGGARTVTLMSRAVDDSGNLEQPVSGVTVTVGGSTAACPCSLWLPSQIPSGGPDSDPNAVELGTRFRSDVAGYITAIRFYKHSQNTGAHTGRLWSAGGSLLSTVTFTGESSAGWQEAQLASPVAITANSLYVVSYHTSSGFYAGQDGYFASAGVSNGPLTAPPNGAEGANGVYRYGPAGSFPNQTYNSENYWVDVVFVTSIGPDTTPPVVSSVTPAGGASAVPPGSAVTATFSENVQNVTASTFELRDAASALVAASVVYNASSRTATLTPSTALGYSTVYTARLRGGSGGIADGAGNTLASDYTWSFTTSAAPPPPPNEGPGGPILVVGSTANPFSRYTAEILRTEGLNAFTATDISQVTATALAAYDVVILGAIPLSTAQVTMFSDWVTAGGNLIALRPDKKLAPLLGLIDAGTTLSEGYLLVNTASAPSAGIVNQTMQFHGTADNYSLNGANAVARLYATSTAATANPAVTLRSVGSNGGQAAAFTFDLPRSIVLTRQGNPAWSGQERDGIAPIRSDDLFFGGAQPDWVDLGKVAIPQADEQQRLLANLVAHVNSDRKPLPRFWYFPRGKKAVVVMTGDDHANNGTTGRFDIYRSNSPANCNLDNWECVRATSYIYPSTPISDAQAAAYNAEGFEIAAHITTGCADYTPTSLQANYANDLAQFASRFPSLPAIRTNRTHCIAWSDFDTQPQVALANGIRLDTNYYYFPGSWVQNRPGFMTGSGMPMRFAKADGTLIDVYQAATQLTDESGQTWPFTIDTLLDRALGPDGFYGAFVTNMHTDRVAHEGSEAIVASAQARSVPVISAKQLLTWLDGRNGSSFGNLAWDGTRLTFTVSVGAGANGIEAMVPASAGAGSILGVTRNGASIPYRTETVKGIAYAMFAASAGTYQALYGADTTAPVISGINASAGASSATITWTTNEPATSRVDYGIAPDSLNASASAAGLNTAHSVQLTGLSSGTTYHYRVTSADGTGNSSSAPATPATFSTTTPPSLNCPCSIWPAAQIPGITSANDASAVELGVKFRTTVDGFITGVRFYKGSSNTGVHIGNLWTSTGTLLGSATFTGESAAGWQEVTLASPVSVTAGTTYVASYHAPNGGYALDSGYFAASGIVSGPLEALANGTAGGNGVYRYGASGFPNQTWNSANYWVDVVFVTSVAPDTTPPLISGTGPAANATNVPVNVAVTATFNEAMTAGSISSSTFELRDAGNNLVAATVAYSAGTRAAILQPGTPLAYSSTYTATVRGGSAGVRDAAGNALASDHIWSFTTSSPPPPPPSEGPGGPILVIASTANPFTRYYAEILRAEGLNAFTVTEITAVTPGVLGQYDVALLGEMPLNASQVTMLANWVVAGGNLIAMRPDKQLAALLGLSDTGTTLSNAYLQVETSAAPGAGIAGETMQFHGTADRYSLNGATSVAALFATASAATANPAVTIRAVGSAGGQAAAFTFDLARSVVYTRQGNPAWAGQDRDGLAPIRSDDLFFGGSEKDWVDLAKVAIPQADEQQRLLANLIGFLTADRKPLPRFWYLPNGHKAAVVMTGDDHAINGTPGRFDIYAASSPAGCNVDDWECVRATSYVYPNIPMSAAQAVSYDAAGFEIGVHISTGCADYTASSLQATYTNDLRAFAAAFPGVPPPRTNRTHCVVWSDYSTQAEVSLAHGVRLDTNYYYWPASWVNNVPGMFTGSGMPMRFAKADGSLIDVYQAATQMTDESGQTYPFTVDALLDRALGTQGYFGTFVANMHTDRAVHAGSSAIVASAQARGVPVISARQLLTWLDGRNGSSFANIQWDGSTLTFGISKASGARGLQAMLPASSIAGPLTGVRFNGTPVSHSLTTVKGVLYAVFAGEAGSYTAEYGIDTVAPVISGVTATPAQTTARITWTTNEPSTSRVEYGTASGTLTASSGSSALQTAHSVQLTGLTGGVTYYFRVISVDGGGNPAIGSVLSFTTATVSNVSISDATLAHFAAGTSDAGIGLTAFGDGEVSLAPSAAATFDGTALPAGWTATSWGAGTATVSGGQLVLDGWRAGLDAVSPSGRVLEFRATFGSDGFQHGGFGLSFNETPWAMFSTGSGGSLWARTHTGTTPTDTQLTGSWLNAPRLFRIEWTASAVVFFIDGTQVASHPVTIPGTLRPLFSDYQAGGASLSVDWMQLLPYASSGTFTSRVLDAGTSVPWNSVTWNAVTPAGNALAINARFGSTPVPDPSWTGFLPFTLGANPSQSSRYVQYRADLTSSGGFTAPLLNDITFGSGSPGIPAISVSDVVVTEGNSGTTNALFLLTLSTPSSQEVRVSYATTNGSATSGSDYTATSGVAVFPAGTTSLTIAVPVIGDTVLEPDETFTLNLSSAINATIARATGVATILNDELPSLSIAGASVTEGHSGVTIATFTVTLSAASTQTVWVRYSTGGGTATAGIDYTAASGTLTFPAGTTTRTISVSVIGDTLVEPDETFVVALSNAANATLATSTATGTIVNDDAAPTLASNDVTVTEGNNGTVNAMFTITLSAATDQIVTVNYSTANGTATAGSTADYIAPSGTLIFASGTTTPSITVVVRAERA